MGIAIEPLTACPGDDLPELETVVSRVQLFFFSAATYNGHRIHYDRDWATSVEGHQDVLVHGPLLNALMTRLLTDWLGSTGRLASMSTTNRASAYPDKTLRFNATVTERHNTDAGDLLGVELRAHNDEGALLMDGRATLLVGGAG